jgi:uncharacterized damage-inducible protein DinB
MQSHHLSESWQAHLQANEKLLDLLEDGDLAFRYAPRVRTIGLTIIHIHNVRRRWLGAGGDVPSRVKKIDRKQSMTVPQLREALKGSGEAIANFLEQAAANQIVPAFSKSPSTFIAYLIAHESHHRGQIMAALRVNGKKAGPEAIYGLWEWDD